MNKEEKKKVKKRLEINLKSINYFYILLQIYFSYIIFSIYKLIQGKNKKIK